MINVVDQSSTYMGKHGKGKRKFTRYLKGSIDLTMPLGTLNGKVATSLPVQDTVEERTWLSSVVARWALQGMTLGTDDGPILVGVCHSDYTSSEIEAWIENTASWTEGNKVQQEVARRFIRRVGIFTNPLQVTEAVTLNDGKPIRTKCGWILTTGQTVRFWAYNMGSSNLVTGTDVFAAGHANLWPR